MLTIIKKSVQLKNISSSITSDNVFCLTQENIFIQYCSNENRAQHFKNTSDVKLVTLTFSDWKQDQFEHNLQQALQNVSIISLPIKSLFNENNLADNSLTVTEMITQLYDVGLMKTAVECYSKCLQAIRIEQLSHDEIKNRLDRTELINVEQHISLLNEITRAYENELASQNTIDFDDMISHANNAVNEKHFTPQWQHILVDEFQDISSPRYQFLDSLVKFSTQNANGDNRYAKLTVVGDDWQSIYRFSGGKLELTTRFTQLIGSHTLSKLQKTFRYNNSIADIAGKFVMKNPEQYKKHIVTHTQVDSPQIFLHDDEVNVANTVDQVSGEKPLHSVEEKAKQIIELIITKDVNATIAVIARYRYQLNKVETLISGTADLNKCDINFWTYHGSKGLEAENTILIGFEQGTFGFPADSKNSLLVESLLPSLDNFPHTEERRLLYVGLTRAKKQAHLIANTKNHSVFIKELIADDYAIQIVSPEFTHMRSVVK